MSNISALKNWAQRGFLALVALMLISLIGLSAAKSDQASPCEGRQWKNSSEQLDCKFPYPPIGRWHAVYSETFAHEHNLPLENISTDLSSGVDYMEMDVQPYGNDGVACLVNMLIQKPHDLALYGADWKLMKLPEHRKLAHLIDLDEYKKNLKPLISFSSASRNYMIGKSGFQASTFAMYAEDVLPGYDYISANAHCRDVSMHPDYFPGDYAFWVSKASIWGRYEMRHQVYDDPETPKGMDFYNAHIFINIPHELVSTVFEGVPIGGR